MKHIILSLCLSVCFVACAPNTVKLIGTVNMISARNVSPQVEYVMLSSYAGGSNKEIKKARAETLEKAIEQTVRKVPGGEFVSNVKLYQVNDKYYFVEGDVWGTKGTVSYRGFHVGDAVVYKVGLNNVSGRIKSLKDDKTCFVEDANGTITERKYDNISKAE